MQDGRLNIDSNLMEQTVRAITLGRKDCLFCGGKEEAENKSTFLTSMVYYRGANIELYRWMKEVPSKPLPDMTEGELTE